MNMKEKFNIRIERVKNYMTVVANYRDVKHKLNRAEREITKVIDSDQVREKFVCIKNYITMFPSTSVFETGDNVYPHTEYCHRFNDKPCPIFNCPFYEKNKKYKEVLSLFNKARKEKKAACKAIFERIK